MPETKRPSIVCEIKDRRPSTWPPTTTTTMPSTSSLASSLILFCNPYTCNTEFFRLGKEEKEISTLGIKTLISRSDFETKENFFFFKHQFLYVVFLSMPLIFHAHFNFAFRCKIGAKSHLQVNQRRIDLCQGWVTLETFRLVGNISRKHY